MSKTHRVTIRLDDDTYNMLNTIVSYYPDSDMTKVITRLIQGCYCTNKIKPENILEMGKMIELSFNTFKSCGLDVSKLFNDEK